MATAIGGNLNYTYQWDVNWSQNRYGYEFGAVNVYGYGNGSVWSSDDTTVTVRARCLVANTAQDSVSGNGLLMGQQV